MYFFNSTEGELFRALFLLLVLLVCGVKELMLAFKVRHAGTCPLFYCDIQLD